MSGDSYKPLLIFRPAGKLSRFVEVKLYPVPDAQSCFNKWFIPGNNNIKKEWLGIDTGEYLKQINDQH